MTRDIKVNRHSDYDYKGSWEPRRMNQNQSRGDNNTGSAQTSRSHSKEDQRDTHTDKPHTSKQSFVHYPDGKNNLGQTIDPNKIPNPQPNSMPNHSTPQHKEGTAKTDSGNKPPDGAGLREGFSFHTNTKSIWNKSG